MMKTLIINGSPRKNGDTMSLVNELIKYLDGEVKIINTYFDNISPCLDCRFCWRNGKCLIKDEMQDCYQLFDEVDNVILASPLHFSELTGKLLSFASRLQYFYVLRYVRKELNFKLKKKNSILIITGGGDGGPNPAISRASIIFKQINAELIGTILSLKTNNIPANQDVKALNKAKELAIRLNELYKLI
ncbi:flavodoxin family protein [Candidatus Clostridium stratigraminis]|uniref:Flavodoxin family protein n=1 Tax=Candidatus Clostridium stratigraminis TaxID=3381661 RepID=A0ABW8T1C6_9CLOT